MKRKIVCPMCKSEAVLSCTHCDDVAEMCCHIEERCDTCGYHNDYETNCESCSFSEEVGDEFHCHIFPEKIGDFK